MYVYQVQGILTWKPAAWLSSVPPSSLANFFFSKTSSSPSAGYPLLPLQVPPLLQQKNPLFYIQPPVSIFRSKPLPSPLFLHQPTWLLSPTLMAGHSLLPPILCCPSLGRCPPLSLQKKCWNKTSPRVVPKPQGKLFFHLVFKGSTDLLQKKN